MRIKLTGRLVSLVLLTSFSLGQASHPPERGDEVKLRFPGIGDVTITGSVPVHTFPTVTVTGSTGQILYRGEIGSSSLRPRYIDPKSRDSDPFPIVRLKVLQVPELQTPIVLAVTMDAGGSDCSYSGTILGEADGKIRPLLAALPMVNTEGGYSIGSIPKESGFGVAAWNMIWRSGEAHVDPHDHWVRIYRYDPVAGEFKTVRKYIVPKSKNINFSNILSSIPDFGC